MAMWARPRAPAAAESQPDARAAHAPAFRRVAPGDLGHRPHLVGHVDGAGVGGGAVAHPPHDALEDRRQAEEVVGEIDVEVGNARQVAALAVARHIVFQPRQSRLVLMADQAADAALALRRRHAPLHQVIGEVGDRIAERGKLPVEHRQIARFGLVQDAVVEAEIAMDDACWPESGAASGSHAISRSISAIASVSEARYCSDQRRTWRGHSLGAGRNRPARRLVVDLVQCRDGGVQRLEDRCPLIPGDAGHMRLPDHPAGHEVHDVERRADDARILAQHMRPRHREAQRMKRRNDAELALDCMGRRQAACPAACA
jgi:hypothetical protein